MPIVRIEMWPGRTKEIKKKVAKEVTDVIVGNMGCPAQAVTVVFDERAQENWATGGELQCDIKK
jgi:4-oxalocrotonate tautomerase